MFPGKSPYFSRSLHKVNDNVNDWFSLDDTKGVGFDEHIFWFQEGITEPFICRKDLFEWETQHVVRAVEINSENQDDAEFDLDSTATHDDDDLSKNNEPEEDDSISTKPNDNDGNERGDNPDDSEDNPPDLSNNKDDDQQS